LIGLVVMSLVAVAEDAVEVSRYTKMASIAPTPSSDRANAVQATCIECATEASIAGLGICLADWVFHNPYCGLLFRCRCTWPWAGGWDGCNVHHPSGPKCPWCNVRNLSRLWWLAPEISAQFTRCLMGLAYLAVWCYQGRHSTATKRGLRAAAAAGTFIAWGFVMALIFFVFTDYPCFLWIADEATNCGFRA